MKPFFLATLLLIALLVPLMSSTAQHENRALLRGKITDRTTSAPLAAELGLAIRTPKGIVMKHTRANEQGEFQFNNLPVGDYHLSTKHDDYAVEHAGFSLQPDDARTFDFRLVKAVPLHGVITDEKKRPLADARVKVSYEQEPGFTNTFQWEEGDVRTDAEGRFTIAVHPERAFIVQAASQGFMDGGSALLKAGDKVALALTRGITVSGTVTDEFGNPLADAQVQIVAEREQAILSTFLAFEVAQKAQQTTVTNADGTFHFENVSPTEHALIVRHPQAEPQRLVADVTSKTEFAVRLNRVYSPVRNDRRQQ